MQQHNLLFHVQNFTIMTHLDLHVVDLGALLEGILCLYLEVADLEAPLEGLLDPYLDVADLGVRLEGFLVLYLDVRGLRRRLDRLLGLHLYPDVKMLKEMLRSVLQSKILKITHLEAVLGEGHLLMALALSLILMVADLGLNLGAPCPVGGRIASSFLIASWIWTWTCAHGRAALLRT